MDAAARAKLRDNIKRRGLLEPLIINTRTGHLLSGHQRLEALDYINRGKGDYELHAAFVDLDEKTEREQNIFLNNPSAQGDWDVEKLRAMLPEIDSASAGFSSFDLQLLFDDKEMSPSFQDNAATTAVVEAAKQAYTPEAYRAVQRENKREKSTGADPKRDSEYYVVVNFETVGERAEFFAYLNIDPADNVDGRLLSKPRE